MPNDEKPNALVLADKLQTTRASLAEFDDLATALRSFADENAALHLRLKEMEKVTEAAWGEIESMADAASDLCARLQRTALALRNDGEARKAVLKMSRDRA